MRNSFIFYSSYYDAISELPTEEQGLIYKAIIDYAIAKKDPKDLTPACRMCFKLIKPTIDAALTRYDASVENGKKGGAPKGNDNAKKDKLDIKNEQQQSTQEQPKINLETTQEQPSNNPTKRQEQPKNNLDKDIDMDVEIDSKLVKNKFNLEYGENCGRVRERTQQEREPFIKFYENFFSYCFAEPWKSLGYEIVDTMIEAKEQSEFRGLKFNHKVIGGKEFAKILTSITGDQLRSIVAQLRYQNINNRPYYILGCIIAAANDKSKKLSNHDTIEVAGETEV